jgi:hypothetical protein
MSEAYLHWIEMEPRTVESMDFMRHIGHSFGSSTDTGHVRMVHQVVKPRGGARL